MIIAIVALSLFGWIIYKLVASGDNAKECPYGYQAYGCQPDCPMYEHCWGSRSNEERSHHEGFFSHHNSDSGQGFLSDNTTAQQEDGDWRTVYMDDTRHYDRECDEEYDHDRFDNGGW